MKPSDERTVMLLPDDAGVAAQVAGQLLSGKADGPLAPAVGSAGTSVVSVGIDTRQDHVKRGTAFLPVGLSQRLISSGPSAMTAARA